MPVRAHFTDGTSSLVASSLGDTLGEVTANLNRGSLTGSAVPDVDVALADGSSRPLASVASWTTEGDDSP